MGTMDMFEVRKAALRMALTWDSHRDVPVTPDHLVRVAEQFAEWLSAPAPSTPAAPEHATAETVNAACSCHKHKHTRAQRGGMCAAEGCYCLSTRAQESTETACTCLASHEQGDMVTCTVCSHFSHARGKCTGVIL